MRIKQKKDFTLGEFIAAAYRVWGKSQAAAMVQSAIDARLLVFRHHPPVSIFSAKGRSL